MNKPLLKKIQRNILKHPEHFDMARWFSYRKEGKYDLEILTENGGTKDIINVEDPSCGTAACIAGWALTLDPEAKKLSKKVAKICNPALEETARGSIYRNIQLENALYISDLRFDFFEKGCEALDITGEQGHVLFHLGEWPDEFTDFDGDTTPELAVKRIDYFMEHGC